VKAKGGHRQYKRMERLLAIVAKASGNYSAYSPDLPGCVATGKTKDQATRNTHWPVKMHLDGLREDGFPIPKSQSSAEYVAVTRTKWGPPNLSSTGFASLAGELGARRTSVRRIEERDEPISLSVPQG